MKKVLFLAVVSLAAASCLKNEAFVVETPQELTFKAVSNVATKADAQLEGTLLNEDYRIYASATQRKADGSVENASYFTDKPFATADSPVTAASTYHAMELVEDVWQQSPIYWPLGGCLVDYVAYAMPTAVHDADPALASGPVASYANASTDVASHLAFKSWDTYKNQVDVLYAVKNGANTTANAGASTLPLTFNHAQALLVFQARVNIEHVMQINEIKINGLLVKGDFVVDNTKNNLLVEWTNLLAVPTEDVVAPGETPEDDNLHAFVPAEDPTADASEYLDNTTDFEQVGSSLLIPQQPALNFVVTYTVSGKTMQYEYNHNRSAWEMGKKYVYNLDITLNEIVITEDVVDFLDAANLVETPLPLN